jgi:hypothetical protein
MYSPDISQHSPRLYRLGRCYRRPITKMADRLIAFGLERLEEVFGPAPVDPAEEARLVAEDPAPYGAQSPKGDQVQSPKGDWITPTTRSLCEAVSDLTSLFAGQPQVPANSRDLCYLVINWAEEFERLHVGETWADREYLEVIEAFFNDHYRAWLTAAPARSVRAA